MIASAIRLGSIDEDFYVHAVDLARLLKTNEVEISRLVRYLVLVRVPDPNLFEHVPGEETLSNLIPNAVSGPKLGGRIICHSLNLRFDAFFPCTHFIPFIVLHSLVRREVSINLCLK